jgi:chromosome segregation ATPase
MKDLQTSDIIAILSVVGPIVWGLVRVYFRVGALEKELASNTTNDEQTRRTVERLQSDLRLSQEKMRSLEEIPLQISHDIRALSEKMDKIFSQKREYIDAEVQRVNGRLTTEIRRIEGLRKEDHDRFGSLLDAMSKNFQRNEERLESYAEKFTALSQTQSEIKGMISTLMSRRG